MPGNRIGLVTIGQSPRDDIVPGLRDMLSPQFNLVESGALDDLGKEEIDALAPVSDDYPLYTRLANGQSVTVAKRLIIPRVQACIDQLNTSGADVIALLCSGAFPVFRSSATLLLPNQMVDHVIKSALDKRRRIAVLLPLPSQIKPTHRRFGNDDNLLLFSLAPAANDDAIDQVALGLKDCRVDLVVLRCFSYSIAMKDAIASRTSSRTILARSLLADSLIQKTEELSRGESKRKP